MLSARLSILGLLLAVAVIFLASSDSSRPAGIRSGDLQDMFIPRAAWLGEAMRQGRLPAWNAEVGCGLDQYLTLQSAVWYPPMWLYGVLRLPAAMTVLLVGHLLLGAGGMYLWIRALGGGRFGAVLAGASFAFGAVGESQWPIILYTLAWTPWLLLLVDGPAPLSGRRWVALATVVALHVLPGYPQLVVYVAMLVSAYVLVRAICERASASVRSSIVARPLTAALLGAALAGVQLIPSFLYMRSDCWRPGSLTPDEVHYTEPGPRASPLQQWSRMLPKAVENSSKDRVLSNRFSYGYLGIFMPFGLAAALVARRSWRTVFFACAGLAGLYLCLGYSPTPLPIYEWLAKLPLFGSFRTPDRLLVWYLIGCCLLLGLGADAVLGAAGRKGQTWLLLAIAAGLIATRAGLWWRLGSDIWNGAVWMVGASLAVAALIAQLRRSDSVSPSWLQPAAVAVLLLDLWLACGYMCPVRPFPVEQFDRIATKQAELLSRDELAALSAAAGPDRVYIAEPYRPVMRSGFLPEFRTLPFYESLMPTRHYRVCDAASPGGVERLRHFGLWNIAAVPHSRPFDLCSVRLLATATPISNSELHGWKPVTVAAIGKQTHVYENVRALTRASLQMSFERVDDATALVQFSATDDSEPPQTVLLDRLPGDVHPTLPGEKSTAGEVRWLVDSAHEVRLETFADAPALLLLTDSWAPGWSAAVDGVSTPVLRANYLHRAVAVPAGQHVVEFRYRVPYLAEGAACSIAACAVAMGVLIFSRRPRAERESPDGGVLR